ncbi:MAG: LTA synthase family protein [Coriobacteriales bacterium]|jgi:hypothetical protein|nr:LTA synthase family protein [Coriobacteriales bacterium]
MRSGERRQQLGGAATSSAATSSAVAGGAGVRDDVVAGSVAARGTGARSSAFGGHGTNLRCRRQKLLTRRRLLFTGWIALVAFCGSLQPAYAYIDPATTSYIIQIVSGLIITLSVACGVFFRRLQMFLVTSRARLAALWVRLTSKKHRQLRQLRRSRRSEEGRPAAATPRERAAATPGVATQERIGATPGTSARERAIAAAWERVGMSPVTRQVSGRTAPNTGPHKGAGTPPPSKREFLFAETRRFRTRLGMAALLAAAIAFSFIFFGICDLFITNRSTLPYYLTDVLGIVVLESLIVFAVLTLVLVICRGRFFDYLLSFFFGLLVMLYIQGNWMNIDLGQLTGNAIPWEWYLNYALLNSAICVLIMLIPFVLRFLSARIWQAAMVFVPALLIVMQLVSLLTSFSTSGALNTPSPQETYLSDKGLYEVSVKHNIIVFILDRLDDRYIEQVLLETPDFFAGQLDGFTRYTNNLSTHSRTYPAIINILTGANYHFERPSASFAHDAYQQGRFLPTLHQQGYTNYVYTERNSGYFDGNELAGRADNVETGRLVVDAPAALRKLTILSFYRYVPHVMKPSFWLSTDTFYDDASYRGEHALYQIDDAAFMANLKQQQLKISDDLAGGAFHFIHLQGSHPPFTLYEDGTRARGQSSSVTIQTRAALRIVFEYLEQLKQLGLYEDASVVITGDHGYPSEGYTSDWHSLEETVFTGLFYKPSGSSVAPLAVSDAPTNCDSLRSTVLDQAGVDKTVRATDATLAAPTYSECTPATVPTRDFYFRVGEAGLIDYSLEQFAVSPEARNFANWKLVKVWPIQYWQY